MGYEILQDKKKKIGYYFEWDARKARLNLRKHKISFERACSVFRDSAAISIYDSEHSDDEDRWITLGLDSHGIMIVVVHTFQEISKESFKIRILSARKATKKETKQYKGDD